MGEDKLTRAERRRLESLAQAINLHAAQGWKLDITEVTHTAETIERWLSEAKEMIL